MANTPQSNTRQKILIISRATFLDIDKIVSAIVLGKLLSKRPNTDVDIFFGEKLPLNTLTAIVAPQDVNFREKLTPDYFTLSINRGNAKIKEVKWEEVGSELKLIIYTDQGEIQADEHTLGGATPAYDAVYAFGIKTKEEALNALGEFSTLWQSTQTFNLDIRPENQRYAGSNHIYADAKSYAECVTNFAQEQELELTNIEATELIACIYWKTNSLRNKYTTADTLNAAQQLIQKGGSVSEAVSCIFATLSFVEVRARQEIYKSLKLTAEKIAFAQISPETARQLSKIEPINPEKNPLFKLKDAITSFILVPIAENKTLVLCSSRDEGVNIKRLFSNYNYVGDALQAELLFNMNLADTEKELKRGLLKVFPQAGRSNKQPETAPTSQAITPVPTSVSQAEIPAATQSPTPSAAMSQPVSTMQSTNVTDATPAQPADPITPLEIPESDVQVSPLPTEEVTAEVPQFDIPAEVFQDDSYDQNLGDEGMIDPLAPADEADLAAIAGTNSSYTPESDDPLPAAN